MSYSHGICGRNNPNCGAGIKGCASENEPDEQDFDLEMTKFTCEQLNWSTNKVPSIVECLREVVDAVESEAGMYEDWLCDNEILEHIKSVIELSGQE